MTVGDIKKIVADLPDDMEVGGSGQYNEFLDCLDISVTSVTNGRLGNTNKNILCVEIESFW